jgi:hypothetical protein
MKDTDLYSRILGLTEPWFVEANELTTADVGWTFTWSTAPVYGGPAHM